MPLFKRKKEGPVKIEKDLSIKDFIAHIRACDSQEILSFLRLPENNVFGTELNPFIVYFPELEHTLPEELFVEKVDKSGIVRLHMSFSVARADQQVKIVITLSNTGLEIIDNLEDTLILPKKPLRNPFQIQDVAIHTQEEYKTAARKGYFGEESTELARALGFAFPTFLTKVIHPLTMFGPPGEEGFFLSIGNTKKNPQGDESPYAVRIEYSPPTNLDSKRITYNVTLLKPANLAQKAVQALKTKLTK